jgi:hypothetical protein
MSLLEIGFLAYVQAEIDEGWYGLGDGSYGLGVAQTVLLERGRYEGANYRVTLTFTAAERGIATHIGPTTTTMELRAELTDTTLDFRTDGDMKAYIPTYAFEETEKHPAVSWDPSDCFVTLELCYDPGMSCTPWRLDQEPLPDPELDYTTDVSEDMRVDYQGRVIGTDREQRFPHAIECCLTYDELTFVVLDVDSDGVADPTVTYEDGRNLFAIDTSGTIVWTAPLVTGDSGAYYYNYIWRVDETLFTGLYPIDSGARMNATLDPQSGTLLAKDL